MNLTINEWLRAIAGTFVLLSLALGWFVHPGFFLFTAFRARFLAAFFLGFDFLAFFFGTALFFATLAVGFLAAGLGVGFGAGATSSGSSPTIRATRPTSGRRRATPSPITG